MQASTKPVIAQVIIPLFILLTWIFTINSYQESTKNQSLQLFHLIPIAGNTKFFSKQLITLIAFPMALFILTAIFIGIIRLFVDDQEVFDTSNSFYSQRKYSPIFWFFGQSICTFFAIIFKKNKMWYSIISYFGFRFALGLVLSVFMLFGIENISTSLFFLTSHLSENWILYGFPIFTLIFYFISYHLFFRRQL
jgi:hypothetical protein